MTTRMRIKPTSLAPPASTIAHTMSAYIPFPSPFHLHHSAESGIRWCGLGLSAFPVPLACRAGFSFGVGGLTLTLTLTPTLILHYLAFFSSYHVCLHLCSTTRSTDTDLRGVMLQWKVHSHIKCLLLNMRPCEISLPLKAHVIMAVVNTVLKMVPNEVHLLTCIPCRFGTHPSIGNLST